MNLILATGPSSILVFNVTLYHRQSLFSQLPYSISYQSRQHNKISLGLVACKLICLVCWVILTFCVANNPSAGKNGNQHSNSK